MATSVPTTILEVFESRVNQSSARPALRRRIESVWTSVSWKEWWEASERLAAGLIEVGVQAGDRVLLLSETRVEWVICDMAIQMLGGVTVPVYPSLGPVLVQHIALDSGAVAAIVSDPIQLDKLVEHRQTLSALRSVFWIEREAVRAQADFRGRFGARIDEVLGDLDPWNRSLEQLAANGRRVLAADGSVVSRRRRHVRSEDVATIVYTSGTTGEPRGVILTQRNLVAQVLALADLQIFAEDDVQVLFLPLAHIFARVLYLAAVGYGIETAVPDDMRNLLADMQEVEPTFFAAVPQLFDQVRAKIERDGAHGPLGGQIFRVAGRLGTAADRAQQTLVPTRRADRIGRTILDRIRPDRARQLFGGRVRFAISGGAPLSGETLDFFASFGLELLQGYGLTETTAVATLNVPADKRWGSVGRPLRGVDMTIDEDGEVLVRGDSVSAGYWHDDEATANSRDADGWYRTGDLGEFDRDGFLHITGRKKELIVTAGGKNVAPVPLEAALERIAVVERAVVFGDRRPFVVALLVLHDDAVSGWAAAHGIGRDEVTSHPEFVAALDVAIDAVNREAGGYAAVKRWGVVGPLSEAAGTLTATGKLRRTAIAELHAVALERLYGR